MIELIVVGVITGLIARSLSNSGASSSPSTEWSSSGDYEFNHRYVNGNWRAYIVRQPGYRGRSEDLHDTHRYRDGREHYVCWSEPVRSRDESVAVANLWKKKTGAYIRNGTRF
ncbi:MAG: hypothetical protein PF904_04715 [Kiritimatiellae bacterium]|jgi:hypothetical protein|nr:hypothetical protein [Kiritimatiellia bacterium]